MFSARILLALALMAGAVSAAEAQESGGAKPIALAGAEQRALLFSRFRSSIRFGDRIGDIRTGTPCGGTMGLTMNARTEQAVIAPVVRVVREEFAQAGYRDPTRRQERLFESEDDKNPPELLLGAMLEEFQTSYCSTASGARTDGTVRAKVRWELYDSVDRKVVFTKVTETSYKTDGEEAMREAEFFSRPYRLGVRELLADREFHDKVLLRAAVAEKPAAQPKTAIVLKTVAPIDDALGANITLTRAAVVTVKNPRGSGSGVFVSQDGLVLTSAHVVTGNRFVRVVLATGRELVGEVVQQDAGRDVALIKTEGSNFVALPVRTEELNVGADVTAIGSPLGEELSGTVTRGVVSGYRTIKGKRYIQSDVSVLPGSSGGPLLDKNGRIAGVTAAGLGTTRINFFVPIQEAMATLGIAQAHK